jgi:hypothetical protein
MWLKGGVFVFEVKPVTKKLKAVVAELGPEYSIKTIDAEWVGYRKINDRFDIEISGLNNRRKSFKCAVYVWDISNGVGVGARSVEHIPKITSLESLKQTLDSLVVKYQSLK